MNLDKNILDIFKKCEIDYKRAHNYYSYPNYSKHSFNKNKKDDATHILSLIY